MVSHALNVAKSQWQVLKTEHEARGIQHQQGDLTYCNALDHYYCINSTKCLLKFEKLWHYILSRIHSQYVV